MLTPPERLPDTHRVGDGSHGASHPEYIHDLVQRGLADAEFRRGGRDFPGAPQRLPDQIALEPRARLPPRRAPVMLLRIR